MIEEEVLKKLMIEEGKTQVEIAKMLGIAQGTVSFAARKYGLKKKRKERRDYIPKRKNKQWTEEEDAKLETLYGMISLGEIAKRLGRTLSSVRYRRTVLNLGNTVEANELIGICDLARATGRDKDTVKDWILKYGLKAEHKVISISKKVYRISIEDFWKWCRNNPKRMKWEKYERNSLGKEPKWLDGVIKEYYKTYSANAGKPWSKTDEVYLMTWHKQGISMKEISKRLKRSYVSVNGKLTDLGRVKQRILLSWKPIEINMLLEMKKEGKSNTFIADELGRSVRSVILKYERLKTFK
jgi:DNA-binding CsgD family transcriptional regulator